MSLLALVLASVLTQEPAPDTQSTNVPGRTASLIAVGVGVPVVGAGFGLLATVSASQQCTAMNGTFCLLPIALGLVAGGVGGLLLMPLALWLTDRAFASPAERAQTSGGLAGALVGLGSGLVVGIGLVALSTLVPRSTPEAQVLLAVAGGVIALGAPFAGYFIGRSLATRPPQVALSPLRDGAMLSVGGTF